MIIALYLVVVLVVLIPSVVVAGLALASLRQSRRVQQEVQQGTSDTVFVRARATMALGPVRVEIYPRFWSAVLLLVGVVLWLGASIFLFFVRQW